MLFPSRVAAQIMQAEKTQIRSPKRPTQRKGRLYHIDGYRLIPREDGEPERKVTRAPMRVLVTDVRRERVEAISDAGVRAEGFRSREKFLDAYEAAFGAREGLCWVLEVQVHEPTLYLAPNGRGNEHGYTEAHDAYGAGGGVSRETLDEFARINGLRRERFLQEMPLHERVRVALENAEARGIDTRLQREGLEKRVRALEAKVRRKVA